MKNLTSEMIEKAKTAKSTDELLELAKANGVEITEDDAKTYFAQLNPKYGEIDDDELGNVSGGACYAGDGRMVVTVGYVCADISGCPHCKNSSMRIDASGCVYCNTCNRQLTCKDCNHMSYEGGMWLCNHEVNRD